MTKWASISYSNYSNKDQLKDFFEQVVVIPEAATADLSNASGSFDCLSAMALRLYLEACVSEGKAALDGLDRMWKIYRRRVNSLKATLYQIVHNNPKKFVMDALSSDSVSPFFRSEIREGDKTEWFGIRFIFLIN